jgi:cell division protein FtsZ
MFEIQDAAKVITESVDPNAKIIFGTVRSDRLKKGEIKITVIASGFPEGQSERKVMGVGEIQRPEPAGKIYNSVPAQPSIQREKVEAEKKPIIEDSDDDWGAVPAFLRRSKLK